MPRTSKYSIEDKLKACEDYLSGTRSISQICIDFGMSSKNGMTIYKWVDKYMTWGLDAFLISSHNRAYTKEFKTQAVKEYISGQASVREIVAKYNIGSKSMLERWISLYNSDMNLKDYNPKPEVYMAESRRKTTKEERIEIVRYCIEHNRDYKETALRYDVSYGQIYSWVRKYDASGEEGLLDKRGHHKSDEEVDELEKLRRENTRLKRQLEEKDRTVELLKKVQEYERRRFSPKGN